jgi:L-rhamnose isomerase
MNKIILTAEADLMDKEAREMILKLWRDYEKINERTKLHTIDIKKIEKKIKEIENK